MTSDTKTICPVCGRYIGRVSCCPYCDADQPSPPLTKIIRRIAVLLATAGLLLLYLGARNREPPQIDSAQITPAMNFARVRLHGYTKRRAYIARENDYISFRVYDDSGSIQVVAYRNTARQLIESHKLPPPHSRITVTGSLKVSTSGSKLIVDSAAQLDISPP